MKSSVVFGVILVAFLAGFGAVGALKCQVCNSEECETQRGYHSEDCPTGVRFCYSLTSERGNIYRAACAFTDCSRIQMSRNSQCTVCDSDNCNGLKSAHHSDSAFDNKMESSENADALEHVGKRPSNPINSATQFGATFSLLFLASFAWVFGLNRV